MPSTVLLSIHTQTPLFFRPLLWGGPATKNMLIEASMLGRYYCDSDGIDDVSSLLILEDKLF